MIFKSFLYLVIVAVVGTDTETEEGHKDADIGGILLLVSDVVNDVADDVANDVAAFPSPDKPNADDLPPLFCC